MQDDISGWNIWSQQFQGIEEISSPSELHGLLTGMLCITQSPNAEQWQQILGSLHVPLLANEALDLLCDESDDVLHALSDDDLDYLPLLPDDTHSLQSRVTALADWCAGVVLGFGLASGHIRADECELIEHLQDVASVEFDAEDDDEEGELSYQELYEFVRLIPVSLAMGRDRIKVEDSSLLKHLQPQTHLTDAANVVEMFNPPRPS